jgi:hypothetical protein
LRCDIYANLTQAQGDICTKRVTAQSNKGGAGGLILIKLKSAVEGKVLAATAFFQVIKMQRHVAGFLGSFLPARKNYAFKSISIKKTKVTKGGF